MQKKERQRERSRRFRQQWRRYDYCPGNEAAKLLEGLRERNSDRSVSGLIDFFFLLGEKCYREHRRG